MIKNFFVKTQVIKNKKRGLSNYINYLKNLNHGNHKGKTERILRIYDGDFLGKTIKNIKIKEDKTQQNKKGGSSFQSYRQSFCLSFPTDTPKNLLTDEILTKIYKEVMKDIFKGMGIPLEDEYLKMVFGNVHFNNNIHINIVLPKVMKDKTYDFSKKSLLNIIKKSFDNQCNLIGLDKKDYKPKKDKSSSLEQYKMSLERKEIYLKLELEFIELKKMKDKIINHKIENVEIKKKYYSETNPFIQNIKRGLEERRKKTQTIDVKKLLLDLENQKPQIKKSYDSVLSYGM